MAKVRYTPEAEEDTVRIGDYIAKENPAAAVAWANAVLDRCALLAVQPEIGQRIHTQKFGDVRRHILGSYLIYYRPISNGVEILTVFHGAREHGRP
jgi:plasmid stabilization system protein ParE